MLSSLDQLVLKLSGASLAMLGQIGILVVFFSCYLFAEPLWRREVLRLFPRLEFDFSNLQT